MNSLSAIAMGMAHRGQEQMVFDWDKAARIIKERNPAYADAGLRDDWEYTGGAIYKAGEPVIDDYTFLASTWAVPELCIDGEVIPCYRMKSETPGWNSGTKWPESALEILGGESEECDHAIQGPES